MTDQEIQTGLRQNDRATTEYLYKTLAPPVFKYVLLNSGTREAAQDLFQETYLKVLKNIVEGKYRQHDKFEAYFLTVARNTWIDQLRARQKTTRLNTDDPAQYQFIDDPEDDQLARRIVHDRQLEALDYVWASWQDTDCQRVLRRFHYDNARTKDIAVEENTSQNTLLQRLFKCRSKLFKLVELQLKS